MTTREKILNILNGPWDKLDLPEVIDALPECRECEVRAEVWHMVDAQLLKVNRDWSFSVMSPR